MALRPTVDAEPSSVREMSLSSVRDNSSPLPLEEQHMQPFLRTTMPRLLGSASPGLYAHERKNAENGHVRQPAVWRARRVAKYHQPQQGVINRY